MRFFRCLLALTLALALTLCAPALAENPHVDWVVEQNSGPDDMRIRNEQRIEGEAVIDGSNVRAYVTVYALTDQGQIAFAVELDCGPVYGSLQDQTYNVSLIPATGQEYFFTATQRQGDAYIYLDTTATRTFIEDMCRTQKSMTISFILPSYSLFDANNTVYAFQLPHYDNAFKNAYNSLYAPELVEAPDYEIGGVTGGSYMDGSQPVEWVYASLDGENMVMNRAPIQGAAYVGGAYDHDMYLTLVCGGDILRASVDTDAAMDDAPATDVECFMGVSRDHVIELFRDAIQPAGSTLIQMDVRAEAYSIWQLDFFADGMSRFPNTMSIICGSREDYEAGNYAEFIIPNADGSFTAAYERLRDATPAQTVAEVMGAASAQPDGDSAPASVAWEIGVSENMNNAEYLVNATPIQGTITFASGEAADACLLVNAYADELDLGTTIDNELQYVTGGNFSFTVTLSDDAGLAPISASTTVAMDTAAIKLGPDMLNAFLEDMLNRDGVLRFHFDGEDGMVMDFALPHNGANFSDVYYRLYPELATTQPPEERVIDAAHLFDSDPHINWVSVILSDRSVGTQTEGLLESSFCNVGTNGSAYLGFVVTNRDARFALSLNGSDMEVDYFNPADYVLEITTSGGQSMTASARRPAGTIWATISGDAYAAIFNDLCTPGGELKLALLNANGQRYVEFSIPHYDTNFSAEFNGMTQNWATDFDLLYNPQTYEDAANIADAIMDAFS